MSATMDAGVRPATKKDAWPLGLSIGDLQRGAVILGSLPTVHRYLRYNDTSDSRTVGLIAQSVVGNDQLSVVFGDYIRSVAPSEDSDKMKVITEILFVCRGYFDEISRREFGKPVLWERKELSLSDRAIEN